jgi:AcrR family transcriptional regulator
MGQISHRDRLLEGAITCLQTKGYARTTARDIAATADANLASIGYHFGSKEALLNEALMRGFEEWTADVVRRTLEAGDTSPIARVATSWRVMFDTFEESRPLLVAFVEAIAQGQHSDELRAQLASNYDHIRQTVADAVRESLDEGAEQRGADPTVIASFLMAVCDGFAMQFLLDPAQTPYGDRLAQSLGAAFASSLERTPAPGAD